ncbi:MAG TPA: hypothetical protein VLS49_03365 [Usitatibacter sp.]|nr:hypothetical protein [Usitatibacter sp.]
MTVEFTFPAANGLLVERNGPNRFVVQIYRCPNGHLNKITWSAAEVELMNEEHNLRLHCERCHSSRIATASQVNSIRASLGLAPRSSLPSTPGA